MTDQSCSNYATLPEHPCFIYFVHDSDGDIVYIGISEDVRRRIGEHKRQKPWWKNHFRVTWELCSSEKEAERRERQLIFERRPRYNIADNPDFGKTTCITELKPKDAHLLHEKSVRQLAEVLAKLLLSAWQQTQRGV